MPQVLNKHQATRAESLVPEDRDWSQVRISKKSMFTDDTWDFNAEYKNPTNKPSLNKLYWEVIFDDNSKLTDVKHKTLLQSCKLFIYSLMTRPEKGNKYSPATLRKKHITLRALLRFMHSNNIRTFKGLTTKFQEKYVAYVNRQDRHPKTKQTQLNIIDTIFEQRHHLDDSPEEIFSYQGSHSLASLAECSKSKIKDHKYLTIPDNVARDLAQKAVNLIREEGVSILAGHLARERAIAECVALGKSKASKDRAKLKALIGMPYSNVELTIKIRLLRVACFIVINFFTGVRHSEMNSFERGQIIQDDEGIWWLHGKVWKINSGHAKWMAPPIVNEAYQVAMQLALPYREKLELEEKLCESRLNKDEKYLERKKEIAQIKNNIFLHDAGSRGENRVGINHNIHDQLKEFVKVFKVEKFNGQQWRLHPHQFRRTFAKFMAANLMNLRYLQEHFKHISLDMTAWYDVDDIELTQMILEYYSEFKRKVVRKMLDGQKITGKGAQYVDKERTIYFAGLTTEQDKDSFTSELATDINLRATPHSWCLGSTETSLCSGTVGCSFDPSNINKCDSALVTDDFLAQWKDMELRTLQALESNELGKFQKEAMSTLLEETIRPILASIT